MRSLFRTPLFAALACCAILTLAACSAKTPRTPPEVAIDLGSSTLYTPEERSEAVELIRAKFATFTGCELHCVRYAGDEADNEENLAWLNSLREARSNIPPEDVGIEYAQVAEFLSDFHSPTEDGPFAWEVDTEYRDYQWWLARPKNGKWEIVSWGY